MGSGEAGAWVFIGGEGKSFAWEQSSNGFHIC